MAAEAEAVGEDAVDFHPAGFVRDVIEVTLRVGIVEVDGWWSTLVDERQDGNHELHPAGCAEQMADRIGVIDKGELVLVEEKAAMMAKLGKRQLILRLARPLDALPVPLGRHGVELGDDGRKLVYTIHGDEERARIGELLRDVASCGVALEDIETRKSSLEEIFVTLVKSRA